MLVSGAAVAARLVLAETTNLVFVTFYPAVMTSAWWGGRGPALLTVALCAAVAEYLWVGPPHSLMPATPQDWMNLLLFVAVGSAIGVVTARLRSVQERLRSVLNATSDGFAIIDREWRYRYVNPRFAALVRLPERDLVGSRLWDLFPDTETRPFAEVARAAMDGVRGHLIVHHERLGLWFDTTVYPVREGVAVVTRDVTDARDIEERRAELLARLEEANRLKDDFLATLSHELRTPLNALVGWAQLLDKAATPPERAIRSIQRNASVLTQLVNDLLDTARIVSGKLHMEMQPTDLADVVREATDLVRRQADEKGLVLRTDRANASVVVMGDGARLQQAVVNLLSNAVKFTPEHGVIELAIVEAEATVTLTVKDTGVGIAPDVLPRIFDRFVQAGGPTEMRTGLGLGLAITKHIADAHGGSVRADSDGLLKGATFSLTLPLAATPRLPTERGVVVSAAGGPSRQVRPGRAAGRHGGD